MNSFLLSVLILLPLAGIPFILITGKKKPELSKFITLGVSLVQLMIVLIIWGVFQSVGPTGINDPNGFQFTEQSEWFRFSMGNWGHLAVDYYLGLDGVNVSLVLLSAIVFTIATLASWRMKKFTTGYFSLFLLLNAAMMGCFVSLDMLLFFLFFEFMLLPMYFLIGIWGGARREYAAIKFFIYTLVGSVLILLVMIGLYQSVIDPEKTAVEHYDHITAVEQVAPTDVSRLQDALAAGEVSGEDRVHTFNMIAMTNKANYIPGSLFAGGSTLLGYDARFMGFLILFIGFAIKLPAVPLHTWLPDAHVEAPTPISVVLAGILLKVGGYGLIRIVYGIFPDQAGTFAVFVGILGMISIVYAAMNALAMQDIKKMIAYSSVSHMGFVLLGLASVTVEGVNGVVYQMFSHGLISSMLFLIAGVIYDRTQDRTMDHYKGLANNMPVYTAFTTVAFFASLGLPGMSGFIAEVMILLGAFNSSVVNGFLPHWVVIVSLSGLVLTAAYYLRALQRMYFGSLWVVKKEWMPRLYDLTAREYLMLIPLTILILMFGIFPALLLDKITPTLEHFVDFVTYAIH